MLTRDNRMQEHIVGIELSEETFEETRAWNGAERRGIEEIYAEKPNIGTKWLHLCALRAPRTVECMLKKASVDPQQNVKVWVVGLVSQPSFRPNNHSNSSITFTQWRAMNEKPDFRKDYVKNHLSCARRDLRTRQLLHAALETIFARSLWARNS